MDRRYTAAWASWAAVFAVIEGVALRHANPHGTLCAHIRAVLSPARRARKAVLAGFLAWLYMHLTRE